MKLETNNALSGFFSRGIIKRGIIEKTVCFHSDDEREMYYEIFRCSADKVCNYYKILNNAKVKMPKLIKCEEENNLCVVCQEYIDGVSMVEWIAENNIIQQLKSHLKYFDILLGYQLDSYQKNENIRIDFNLNNFVLRNNELYLVDIMPPLFIDESVMRNRKKYNAKAAELVELYFNINYQIVSLIGYWFMECIYDLSLLQEPNRRNKVKEIVSKFVECGNKRIEGYNKQFPKIDKEYIYEHAGSYFFMRLYWLYEYIESNIVFEELVNYISKRRHKIV